MSLVCWIFLATSALAQDLNHAMVHVGYGTVMLGDAPISGLNVGLQYRSSLGAFAVDAEPISVVYDDFGDTSGFRIGFLSPGVRVILFEERKVSPSLGAGVGFNFAASSNDATGFDYGALVFEGRLSAMVELARASDRVHPTLEVQYVAPLSAWSSHPDRQPHTLLARVGIAFPTRVSALDMVGRWFD